jgi:tetratricopeptide (TPR) repeat protein
MKKYIIITVLVLLFRPAKAQTALSAAFAKSYAFEAKFSYAEAINALKEVYDKSSYETNLRLGWLYYKAGMHKESLSYYKIATVLMPYAVEAKLGCTYPAAAAGNKAELIEQYDQVLVIDPQNATANYWRGMIHYENKEYGLAFKRFEKLVNLYPFGHDGLLMFAWTNLRLGKNREAIVLFNKVLLIDPSDKSALEGLEIMNK